VVQHLELKEDWLIFRTRLADLAQLICDLSDELQHRQEVARGNFNSFYGCEYTCVPTNTHTERDNYLKSTREICKWPHTGPRSGSEMNSVYIARDLEPLVIWCRELFTHGNS
jgi:hypothetical protein